MSETETNETSPYPNQPETSEKAPSILVKDAFKIYKRGKIDVVALRGLNCEFYPGEITVIMGPSGCGKTTLLNMIGGLDRLSSGKIMLPKSLPDPDLSAMSRSKRKKPPSAVHQVPVEPFSDVSQMTDAELEAYRRSKVGFVFQFLNLIPELTAEENIHLPLELAKRLTKEKIDYISGLLDLVGLTDRKNHRPDELSGGEQQRIGVAAALANDPDIILCDEPTGELDSASKQVVMELLRKVIDAYPAKTMIIVTHDAELKSIADRMYYIRDGAISHSFSRAELEEMKQRSSEEDQSAPGEAPKRGGEEALIELRELDHIIKTKIDKIEKQRHPV